MNALKHYPDIWHRQSRREIIVQWLWLAGTALAVVWSMSALDIEWSFLRDAHTQAADLIGRMFPPQWAFLAARNTTANSFTWAIGRAILVGSRSINTIIWGLLFVAIFSPGAVAGVFAVAARSVGFIAKLIAEAIEEVDDGQIEAVRATGASTLQVWWVAIFPQILPVLVGTSIYRWDINVRESSVLGFVGAGGIGLYLNASINTFAWTQVLVILFAILVIVLISEAISAQVRARIS